MANDTTIELASLRFDGKRFEDHALDVECTQELTAYRTLVLECAKELWRRKNPGRMRLPRGFEDGFRLEFDRVLVRRTNPFCQAPTRVHRVRRLVI